MAPCRREAFSVAHLRTTSIVLASAHADRPLPLMDYRVRMIPAGSGDTIATTGIGTGPFNLESPDPERLSGLTGTAHGAPRSGTGCETQGAIGLPSATARPRLRRSPDER